MKCIKNKITQEILRVNDNQANQMVGVSWKYIPKSEWKVQRIIEVSNQVIIEKEKKEKTLSKKASRRLKLKEKQRQ